ncbi:MAG TPA: nucleotidyl transferase AbiEii/AbiGii toxin family protein [Chitinophagaceae bacterium]|nr:nucleotidyl transferase AbiEii/AbiGii toxin family protein [Chitinophagaceae bacterium]
MLHLNTIDTHTHQALLSLLSKDYFSHFALVGGTSLSLRYGHRVSIDIDLFSTKEFDTSVIDSLLKADYPEYAYRGNNRYMLFCNIGPVKTDIVFHPFELLSPIEEKEGIRLFSVKDVAAMKLFAICKRGTRKDFYDLWMLLQHFSPADLAGFFVKKYGQDNLIFLRKSIIYFEEVDESDQPEVLIPQLTWDRVKKSVYQSFINL